MVRRIDDRPRWWESPGHHPSVVEDMTKQMVAYDQLPRVIREAINNTPINCKNPEDALAMLVRLARGGATQQQVIQAVFQILEAMRLNELAFYRGAVAMGEVPIQSDNFVIRPWRKCIWPPGEPRRRKRR